MKKIAILSMLFVAFNSQAFWNNNNNYNNTPWGNFNGNNNPWNQFGNYVEDNGIFGFNPYEYTDPRWYPEEMGNMFDEFDDGFGGNDWGNTSNYTRGNFANPYNQYNQYRNNGVGNMQNNMPNNTPNNPYFK